MTNWTFFTTQHDSLRNRAGVSRAWAPASGQQFSSGIAIPVYRQTSVRRCSGNTTPRNSGTSTAIPSSFDCQLFRIDPKFGPLER